MRLLANFLVADRTLDTDDSAALQRALDAGPGVVHVAAGLYRVSGVRIPSNTTLQGEGAATIIRPAKPDSPAIFSQEDVGDWTLRDLVLDGEAPEADWQTREDRGQNGIAIARGWGFQITGVVVRNFAGAGVQIAHTRLSDHAPFCNGGNLDRVSAHGNHVGIRFDERGEYLNCSNLSAWHNRTGVVIHAGNVKIVGSNICTNVDGLFISDKVNGSHGVIASTLINHNHRHALWARDLRNGMVVSNCCFFYGDIDLENTQGVLVTDSEICCNVFIRGQGVSRFADNYVIPHEAIARHFEMSPETIVQSNFTAKGPWTNR